MAEPEPPADVEEDLPAEAPRSSARRVAVAGARGVIGLLGIGAAAACVAAASLLPLPVLGTGAASTVVTPVAATQQRICAGPVLRLGDDTGQEATTAISLGRAAVTRAATSGTPALEDMDPTGREGNTPSQRLVLDAAPEGTAPGILAGSQSQEVSQDEYVGFAASECAIPGSDGWLVGGSTVTGRTTLLALNNPSQVSSTVSLTIYSENGIVTAAGTDGIVVPPGGQRILSLAGFAPGIASPVVHVVSTGGQVTANLQQSIVRTLSPGGVDVVGASARPSSLNVIPGIVVSGHDAVDAAVAIDGYQDAGGVLRILIPAQGSFPVTISAYAEDGTAATSTSTLTIDGGAVTDIPLGDFADGSWTITVASETPAVVAARTTTVTLADATGAEAGTATGTDDLPVVAATDFAWFTAAPALRGLSLVSVAPGPAPVLHLVNTGAEDAVVSVDETSGASTTVTVTAGTALAVPVSGGTSFALGGFEAIRAAVSYRGDGELAGFVVSPPQRISQPVTVFSQYG
jgi:hypothetical protein